ncbi:MAG: hypothetical protein V1739_01485 [Candidatus Omnitrophota bacterium]
MKFMTGLRILLIGILMVSTAGCLNWGNSNSYVANEQTSVVDDEGPDVFPKGEELSVIPNDGLLLADDATSADSNPVPEPMSILLLGPALLGLLGMLIRKKA